MDGFVGCNGQNPDLGKLSKTHDTHYSKQNKTKQNFSFVRTTTEDEALEDSETEQPTAVYEFYLGPNSNKLKILLGNSEKVNSS